MAKYKDIADRIAERVGLGDYALLEVPSEDRLAREAGVSRMTARKALNLLTENGTLQQEPGGRRSVNRSSRQRQLQIAFLAPAYDSPLGQRLRTAADQAADMAGARMRALEYLHWDSPVITEALEAFDGVFLMSCTQPMPAHVLELLKNPAYRVVCIERDMSAHGIPSIELTPPVFVQRLLDHLASRGHTAIDCFNVQPHDPEVDRRISQWDLWKNRQMVDGRLLDVPVRPYADVMPAAYEHMSELLDSGYQLSNALLCITEPAAIGVARALYEHGIEIGRDIALCTFSSVSMCRYYQPSITCIEMPDARPYLTSAIQWMIDAKKTWPGSLLLQPAEPNLVVGESTTYPN